MIGIIVVAKNVANTTVNFVDTCTKQRNDKVIARATEYVAISNGEKIAEKKRAALVRNFISTYLISVFYLLLQAFAKAGL
jgi:hypothetical protein